nr:MAG TPA: hypothetical protein [Caudoviricetes sp.]
MPFFVIFGKLLAFALNYLFKGVKCVKSRSRLLIFNPVPKNSQGD